MRRKDIPVAKLADISKLLLLLMKALLEMTCFSAGLHCL